ncbi:MAG: protein phosphatase 2C domain-containing protein, partial [Actinomycetota bacterium]|nr:protein phosphatase 2C domain-containing protein [Actinomycetota bacterium]
MTLLLRYAARSDVGLLRDGNEDSGYAGPRLLAVADGMGGHAGGEVASAVAVAALAPLDAPRADDADDADNAASVPGGADPLADLPGRLTAAVEEANAHLRRIAADKPELEGMGTTVTALLRDGDRLGMAHIGDSRGYLLRDAVLRQITRDHTLVQSLVDEGRITAAQAEHHPQRSLLTRALDGRPDVEPDLDILDLTPGDRFLLCSDGLSGVVSEESMQRVLTEVTDPGAACETLIDLALRAGGPDNITCVVADVIDVADDEAPRSARVVVGSAEQAVRPVPPSGGGAPVAPAAADPVGAE